MAEKKKVQRSTGSVSLTFEKIQQTIHMVRGERVMIDFDLASLYSVETGALNRAVKRNLKRFPVEFMFQLSSEEFDNLRCQSGIFNLRYRRYLPYVFTEQGVAMLSSVLSSDRAIQVNIEIMKAFVRMRRMVGAVADLARKVDELEKKYDENFAVVFDAIRQLMIPPEPEPKGRIGFKSPNRK